MTQDQPTGYWVAASNATAIVNAADGADCPRVNAWTPEINGPGKRPVLVWLHGDGFLVGSGHELVSYDGEPLARSGDVVVLNQQDSFS